ncbi:uncharacterized protein PHACADRAFT_260970 [Phanerochaete carnosa HHB-10118-sp]|uniref:Uncharacterized protein n=1 Tax=Phanerochaete carnosa (strain HHB-10118-sp) TaxID=650164 RepID=K5URJ1_PHACS|nr:uncharacterized protein PHACADRAFT_260970 [Phanerochaete carnosa HHB-10118-sp]EKM52511.1 hypothetical protein PHACADRAFT_260970 [Phanerochaete carnosa HHB-10118-sp]
MNAKKKSLIHAMKKAGSRAARKLASRSWGRHHSRLTSAADVQAVFDEPTPKPAISHASESNCDQTSTGANVAMEEVSNGSTDSLTAVHGSPETKCFESPPILCARDSVLVARCQETRVRLPLDEGFPPMRFTVFRFCLQMLLFIPYVVLVGFLPFLAPTCLSRVTFNSFLRFTIRPAEPMEVFAQYSRQLPWHVGVALGLLFVATRALGKAYPGLAVALMAALIGRTMWAWGDFDSTLDVGDACLGIDDRATIWWLLRGFVLGDLVCSMDDFRKWYVDEKDIDSGEEDGEMETLERKDSSGKIDFGIRLRNRPQECFRIVADCEESF